VLFILGIIKGEKIIKNIIRNGEKEKPWILGLPCLLMTFIKYHIY
jgi:hypothetical protein